MRYVLLGILSGVRNDKLGGEREIYICLYVG
jgi:hypothetical protein